MISSVHSSLDDRAPSPRVLAAAETTPRRLILRATDGGWMLLGPDGEIVFHGVGLLGRQQCLEFARDHGVISVLS